MHADAIDHDRPALAAASILKLEKRFLKCHRRSIGLAFFGLFAAALPLLPVPLLQGRLMDWLLDQGDRACDAWTALAWVGGVLVASAACYLARTALAWRVNAVMSRVSLEVVREMTDAMHQKLQRLPLPYYDRHQTGRIMARITNDVGSVLIFLNTASLQLFSDLILALGIAAVMLWLDCRLALICLATLPLFALNHRAFSPSVHRHAADLRAQTASIYALLSERVSAIRVIRSFAQEEAELREFDQRLAQQCTTGAAHLSASALAGTLALLIGGAGSVAILVAGIYLIRLDQLSIGGLLAFYALAGQLYGPIIRLAHFHGIVAATAVAIQRIGEVLDEPEAIDRPHARNLHEPHGPLVFENVTFAYGGRNQPAIQNVNLRIEPGTTLGVLGPSGAGKSTLLALATRLYDIGDASGAIRFGAADIRDLRCAELRRAVLLVPQNAILFGGTLRSNLVYARPSAPDADIRKALRVVQLEDLIARLPRGLDTPVSELGTNFSGGQRQRLALARALIADPAVLLMDDCTSALDAATEAQLLRELATAYPGQTRLIVAHRLAALEKADHLIVLENGQIVDQGAPAELALRDGFYATSRRLQRPGLIEV